MKSIFILCDFGIPYNTVEKLYDNNIKIVDIINDPSCLNGVLGIRSQKAENVKDVIIDVISFDNDYSIYDLIHCGLSKNIGQLLVDNNIKFNDINDKLLEKDFISYSTYKKIMNSYNVFIKENNIKFDLTSNLLINFIKNEFGYDDFFEIDLMNGFKDSCYKPDLLGEKLIELLDKKILKKKDEKYSLIKPRLCKELEKINKENNHYNMVLKKLNGLTLESIGNEYNVTRERIRQIIQKELKKLNITREEEKYTEIFETYNFDCELFCEFYNEEQIVYYYLKEKCNSGIKEPVDMIDELNLTRNQLSILKRKYNLINYNGEYIVIKRNNILSAIIKKFNKLVEYSDIINEYNRLIQTYNLSLEILTEDDFRNIDSILERMPCILCSAGRYYRYYDIDVLEASDIGELKEMLRVEPGDYSSEYFYNNNKQIMKKFDIRSEYELHNLLRKIIGDSEKEVVFSRMPDIFINCNDKFAFIEDLIHELSPINIDEFAEYVYQNYGHKINTFKALLMSYFNKYITNGVIMSDCAEFDEQQLSIIKEHLIEDVYSISTIKELLTELFDVEDFRLLNNLNMQKVGYKLRGNYIMKSTISNLEGYMKDYINNNDYYEIKPEYKKIGSTFSSYLYKFIYNLDLFKIDDEKYITIKKLNELGITKDDINIFISEIEKVINENEFFNLYSLDKDNFLSNLKKHNFPDCFYETIISAINDVKTFSLKNNVMFIKTEEQVTRKKFINSFIVKDKTYIKEIKDAIFKKYNINLYEYYIKEFINTKKYYLDNSIDCVYLNRDLYEEDINDIDILQYID